MAELFRKSSLDKLSSPEQLDRTIVITSPSFWVAMVGAFVAIFAALIWSVVGRLPIQVEARGIYLQSEGLTALYAQSGGIVTRVEISEGDAVQEGQTLVTIADATLSEDILRLQERNEKVNAVTFTSVSDESTADTQQLAEMKIEYATANSGIDETT
ncbi:MAG: biotin/lipoyl-binding protein, partial [Oscillospiraceae bacterium]